MKPIRLDIAGLQSYREAQSVDFERLCQGGVFGIFGPTGSGKSSILDAMTLALYGKVERAAKGTQGIMNGAENKLSVALTFELAGAGKTERYRVERQYKRAGETAVHGAICRLVQVLPEGDVVLADKMSEVDAGVEQLIGLAMPDFTRAVVLPQGKFAEFLTLAGKDRRSMLQRLFRLERYGDSLAAKLSGRADAVKLSLRETEAEQQGLGDASPESLQAAIDRLAEARGAAAALRQRLAEAEERHAELSRKRELAAELERIEKRLAELAAQEEIMAGKERRLEKLRQAAELAPALRDADEAEQLANRCVSDKESARFAFETSRAAADTAAEEWERLRKESDKREPELLVAIERMEQAVQLEAECRTRTEEMNRLTADKTVLTERSGQLAVSLAEMDDLLARGKSKQALLKERLTAAAPLAERHGRLQAALSRKEQWAAAQAQAEEASAELRDIAGRMEAASARLRLAESAQTEAASVGRELLAWSLSLTKELERFQADAEQVVNETGAAVERQRAREREAERLQLAHLLAEHLTDGTPCPVCGSADHPNPAAARTNAAALSDELQAMTAAMQRIGQLQQEARNAVERAGWYRNRLAERMPDAGVSGIGDEAGRNEAEAARASLEAAPDVQSGVVFEAEPWIARWSSLNQRQRELAARCDRWDADWAETARESGQAREAATAAAANAEQAGARASKLAEQASVLLASWQTEYSDLRLDEVAAAAAEAAAADQEARTLRERLDASIGFLEQQERKRQETERESHGLALKQAEANARLDSVASELASSSARLREMTGGESAALLADRAKAEWQKLRSSAAEAKARADNGDRERIEAQRRLDAAAERELSAIQAKERAFRRLKEGMEAFAFAELGEIRQLLVDKETIVSLQQEIAAYRQAETQLVAQCRLLQERLSGETVTAESWEQSSLQTEALRRETEETLAGCAKAERDVEDLSSRRERWEALESRRVSLAEMSTRIGQLQSVFRGNAFVEYVAEEQLEQVSLAASERLGFLTRRRYALEVDAAGGFVIRDDANGGVRRPVSTLSGGETFLTSLALALALSAQIQLRGKYPLQFFFLDEGFGTLDPELLETVVTALEKLQHSALAVGVISHVPELQARLPRKLFVSPAEPGGRGSRITYETM